MSAASAFNPPSSDPSDYTSVVFFKKDLKVGKYYGIGMYGNADSIVKITKVTPFSSTHLGLAPFGAAAVTAQDEGGSTLSPQTLYPYNFFEYRMKPSAVPVPNSMEANEPLNAAGIAARNTRHKEYQKAEALRRSLAFYSRRRRGGRRSNRRRHTRR
jgi:hypothetical protein